jgi:hypothetical protein
VENARVQSYVKLPHGFIIAIFLDGLDGRDGTGGAAGAHFATCVGDAGVHGQIASCVQGLGGRGHTASVQWHAYRTLPPR